MKRVPQGLFGKQQMMSDVEIRRAEIGEAKRRDDIPHAEKPYLRRSLHHDVGAFFPNSAILDEMAEIERRGRTAAESDDVDDLIAVGPCQTELVVGLVQPDEFA